MKINSDTAPFSFHGLKPQHLEIIQNILKPYASQIDQIYVFGSRATGKYRDNSDIDLVLFGPSLNQKTINHLLSIFSESSLPYKVDLIAYELINNPALKNHIDQVGKRLLTQASLKK